MRLSILCRSLILFGLVNFVHATINNPISICAIRISFEEDELASTTGNGNFLYEGEGINCNSYTLDPVPHDKEYFQSQLVALDSYFSSISYGKFGVNIEGSSIFPSSQNDSYQLPNKMNHYNPYNEIELQELRLTELFKEGVSAAYDADSINYSDYDLIVLFHAGIGQDFSLPFLDPTPEDIPSTYVDTKMIEDNLNESFIIVGDHIIQHGIILPETQNHLLYDISESMFSDALEPCEYQYGLTGTFALMVGFAIGLPPLWDVNSGESRIGVFGLMDQGSNNGRGIIPSPPTAWSRIHAGWEIPNYADYNTQIYLPLRSNGNIIKIPISDDEYYLIENRSNDVRNGVSIDSIRYLMGINSNNNSYPPYIEILQDSTGIEKDDNGVVISVPNYDIGLPASGLLIWHIDDNIISSSIDDYGINNDVRSMGVDLEEADGAQDIGYPSIFLFNDPSSGYFGDMWFRGNTQFTLANPSLEGLKPEFGPYTYPSTEANNGSKTYIKIGEISMASDTMRFILTNNIIAEGYPDSEANIRVLYDIDRDGENDVFGGKDSLFLRRVDNSGLQDNFHPITTEKIYVTFIEKNDHTILNVIEHFQDSTLHSIYHYELGSQEFSYQGSELSDTLFYPVVDQQNEVIDKRGEFQWDIHTNRVFSENLSYGIDLGSSGIAIERFGEMERKWEDKNFEYISGIDLDLDANLEVLAIDSSGMLYAFNSDLILMSGFPFKKKVIAPALAKDTHGDEYTEIIVRSADNRTLYVIDHRGVLNDEIALDQNDQLIGIAPYKGKSSVYTSSTIFQFKGLSNISYPSNSWTSFHGDNGNTRKVELDYEFVKESESNINRAYCYPNPIRNEIGNIRIESTDVQQIEVKIYDLAGFFMESFSSDVQGDGNQITEWKWNVNGLEPGVFFANVQVRGSKGIESAIIKIAVID